jgi:hypothetical protein
LKFKSIFILFNVILLFAFILLLFMPLIMMGPDFALTLYKQAWYFYLILLLVFLGLNGYFLANRKTYTLLEEERWQELTDHLLEEVLEKSRGIRGLRLNRQNLGILISGLMLTSRMDKLEELNRFLKEHQPRMHRRFLLPLGYPHLLSENPAKMEEHYGISLQSRSSGDWPRWFYGFSLTLQGKMEPARESLQPLFSSKDLILRLMSLYLFTLTGIGDEEKETISAPKKALSRVLTPTVLDRLKKQGDPLLFLVLSDLLDKSYQWLRNDGDAS